MGQLLAIVFVLLLLLFKQLATRICRIYMYIYLATCRYSCTSSCAAQASYSNRILHRMVRQPAASPASSQPARQPASQPASQQPEAASQPASTPTSAARPSPLWRAPRGDTSAGEALLPLKAGSTMMRLRQCQQNGTSCALVVIHRSQCI